MWFLSLSAPLLTVYLFACALTSACALSAFAKIIQEHLAVQYNFGTELFMVVGQVVFQWLFLFSSTWTEKKSSMIVALTVSMIGSFMLLPLLLFHSLHGLSTSIAIVYFSFVVATIFALHIHLITKLLLPKVLTVTWVLYRLLLLVYVLFPRGA